MQTVIILILILIMIFIWLVSMRRRLVALDENVMNAMCHIGVLLNSCFESLITLVKQVEKYAENESTLILVLVKSCRRVIDSKSTPDDVVKQENLIFTELNNICAVADSFPELSASHSYTDCLEAVKSYKIMVRTSRLIYNDSVTKLNREIRRFPTSIAAGAFGFSQRKYLETEEEQDL